MKAQILATLSVAMTATALAAEPQVPYPDGYRDWHHVKSMVIEEGHPLYSAFGGIHTSMPTTRHSKATAKGSSRTAP